MDAETVLTADGFQEALKADLEREITVYPARAWYPSSIGHPCDRFLVWNFTKWQLKARHSHVLQSIFGEGNLHQPAVYRRLESMGFDVVRESDRPRQYTVGGGAVISGRVDGKIRGYRTSRYLPYRMLEIKTTQGYTYDRLGTMEDVTKAPQHYVRAYADQAYLGTFLEDLPEGVIILKNKQTGMLKAIPFTLDYRRAEELLRRVERLQPMVTRGIDPPPIPYDQGICGGCPYLGTCYPPRDYGEGAAILDDPAFVEELEQREKLRQAHSDYDDLDKSIKARLKREKVRMAIAGPFLIEATDRPIVAYTVPARTDTVFSIKRVKEEAHAPRQEGGQGKGGEGGRAPVPDAAGGAGAGDRVVPDVPAAPPGGQGEPTQPGLPLSHGGPDRAPGAGV